MILTPIDCSSFAHLTLQLQITPTFQVFYLGRFYLKFLKIQSCTRKNVFFAKHWGLIEHVFQHHLVHHRRKWKSWDAEDLEELRQYRSRRAERHRYWDYDGPPHKCMYLYGLFSMFLKDFVYIAFMLSYLSIYIKSQIRNYYV